MKKIISAFCAVCTSFILLSGCTPKEVTEYSSKGNYFFSMATGADLIISDIFTSEKQKNFESLCNDISGELYAIDSSLSINVNNSSINKFNAAAAGETVEIDYTAYEVLTLAKNVYTLTEGYYNPAVYYSVQAYGFNEARDSVNPVPFDERIPDDYVIEKYQQLSSHFGEIEIYREHNRNYAKKPDVSVEIDGVTYCMKIDLGGIGKGYAVDKVNGLIDKYGFKYGYFSFGTSSILCKEHYLNGSYKLAFTNPRSDAEGDTYISTTIMNVGLSSSGDYEQYFLYDGDGDGVKERYCHVFDPTTGKPVQTGIMSASVIGGSAAEDDALTTAIMAMGKERAVKFINENLSDKKAVFTYDNNGVYEIITNIPESELTFTHSRFTLASTIVDGKIVVK